MSSDNKTSLPPLHRKLAAEADGQSGLVLIAKERLRQTFVEGYTPEHDDEHDLGELALAAALYALPYDAKVGNEPLLKQDDFVGLHIALEVGCNFIVKPDADNMRRLVKAGALIVAEIERIQRTKSSEASAHPDDPPASSVQHETEFCSCLTPFGSKTCHHCKKSIAAGSESVDPVEVSALRLFKAFQRGNKLDMAQAVTYLMEIYYSRDETLIDNTVCQLETLSEMSDQEWPAIIG